MSSREPKIASLKHLIILTEAQMPPSQVFNTPSMQTGIRPSSTTQPRLGTGSARRRMQARQLLSGSAGKLLLCTFTSGTQHANPLRSDLTYFNCDKSMTALGVEVLSTCSTLSGSERVSLARGGVKICKTLNFYAKPWFCAAGEGSAGCGACGRSQLGSQRPARLS